jgi:glutamate synthase domain-containing protein 3
MVELEALSTEDATMLAVLLEEHVQHTGSELAQGMLDDWEKTIDRFVKVVPTEFRKVMEEMAKATNGAHPSITPSRDSFTTLPTADLLRGEATS